MLIIYHVDDSIPPIMLQEIWRRRGYNAENARSDRSGSGRYYTWYESGALNVQNFEFVFQNIKLNESVFALLLPL